MKVETTVLYQREFTREELADLFSKKYTDAQLRKIRRRATWIRGACAAGIMAGVFFGLWAAIAKVLGE